MHGEGGGGGFSGGGQHGGGSSGASGGQHAHGAAAGGGASEHRPRAHLGGPFPNPYGTARAAPKIRGVGPGTVLVWGFVIAAVAIGIVVAVVH